ncbi:MAG: DNA polymerase IV [Clostridiales bacterium]|nr:DNA polymerase IV [Clostridiales bacterium]
MTDRVILHCDLNNFYASAECISHNEWKDVPLAVCGNPELRHGVVLAKNEIAKKLGVKTGDVIWQAKQKAPGLIIVPPHFDLYMAYSKQMFKLYNDYTDMVEPFGADECWLDVTGSQKLFGDGITIADKIRERVKKESGLTCSVGVSFNKVFAKLGSDLKKPDATTVIDRNNFKRLIWGLDANEMLSVGRRTYDRLLKLNIKTIGDLARADEQMLKSNFGIIGSKMKAYANGEDNEPVREAVLSREVKSIGHGMTAVRDIENISDARDLIYYLSEKVAVRMRKAGYRGSLVSVGMRDNTLFSIVRQRPLMMPTYSSTEIAECALSVFSDNWNGDPMRTLTVAVSKLEKFDEPRQLSFLTDSVRNDKLEKLDEAIDKITNKYGNVLHRASLIGKDFIYDKTDAEDFLPFQR